jgi:VWFA-related protein
MIFHNNNVRLTAWILAIGFSIFAFAQEVLVIKVKVNAVNVLATVRDRSGNLVDNLSKDDFMLEEDGKPQEIRYFSRQTDMPLTIGLLLDFSMSQYNVLQEERIASSQFLEQVLRPGRDRVFMVKFDKGVELWYDLDSPLESLLKTLKSSMMFTAFRPVKIFEWSESPGHDWPERNADRAKVLQEEIRKGLPPRRDSVAGNMLFDAIYFSSSEIMQQQEGRKAVICLSSGVDFNSRFNMKTAIEAAQRADTLIYCIRFFDSNFFGRITPLKRALLGKEALIALSKETGGGMFDVTEKLTLKEIFEIIQEELRNQYNIGYEPPASNTTGFHSIKLKTKNNKLNVRSRTGYYYK